MATTDAAAKKAAHTPGPLVSVACTDERMRVSGTQAWGECHEIVSAPSGDLRGADALFVGFVLTAADAERIVRAWNAHDDLLAACKAFAKWFDGWCPTATCCGKTGLPVHEQVLAAIAKAESPSASSGT